MISNANIKSIANFTICNETIQGTSPLKYHLQDPLDWKIRKVDRERPPGLSGSKAARVRWLEKQCDYQKEGWSSFGSLGKTGQVKAGRAHGSTDGLGEGLWKPLDFRRKRRPACGKQPGIIPAKGALTPCSQWGLPNVMCHSLATQGWEWNVLISQSNLIFKSQQTSTDGRLQAIVVWDVCSDLLPPGLLVGARMSTIESPSSERVGTPALTQACPVTWGAC